MAKWRKWREWRKKMANFFLAIFASSPWRKSRKKIVNGNEPPSNKHQCSITVISPDADIFVTLLYHLNNTWNGMELHLLKKGRVKVEKVAQNELYPLHKLVLALNTEIVRNLPAGHALTGCDSVAKEGTKTSLFKVLETD